MGDPERLTSDGSRSRQGSDHGKFHGGAGATKPRTTVDAPRPGTHHAVREWGAVIGASLARAYLAFFGTLILVALLPLVCSWDSYVVRSGSMEPTIHIGDVVVASPAQACSPMCRWAG